MIYSLNSLKGGYIGDYIGTTIEVIIKGDTRSLDSGSHAVAIKEVGGVVSRDRQGQLLAGLQLCVMLCDVYFSAFGTVGQVHWLFSFTALRDLTLGQAPLLPSTNMCTASP